MADINQLIGQLGGQVGYKPAARRRMGFSAGGFQPPVSDGPQIQPAPMLRPPSVGGAMAPPGGVGKPPGPQLAPPVAGAPLQKPDPSVVAEQPKPPGGTMPGAPVGQPMDKGVTQASIVGRPMDNGVTQPSIQPLASPQQLTRVPVNQMDFQQMDQPPAMDQVGRPEMMGGDPATRESWLNQIRGVGNLGLGDMQTGLWNGPPPNTPPAVVGRGGNVQASGSGQFGGAPPPNVLARRAALANRMRSRISPFVSGGDAGPAGVPPPNPMVGGTGAGGFGRMAY